MSSEALSVPLGIVAAAPPHAVAAATETPAPSTMPIVATLFLLLAATSLWWLVRWDLRQQRTDVSTASLGGTQWFWEPWPPRQRLMLTCHLVRIDVRNPTVVTRPQHGRHRPAEPSRISK